MKKACLIIIVLVLIVSGCVKEPEKLDLSIVKEPDVKKNDTAIKIAIASVISPKESFGYYEEMIKYISVKLGGPVKIVQRRTYQEINDLLKTGEIDFAFICSGPYIEGNKEFGLKLLVVPQTNGTMTYYSYIIVPRNSSYMNLSDLRGKRFAFTDPLSNTGWIYPAYRIYMQNETPDSFFGQDEKGRKNYFYTYSHDNSVKAVADRIAEGAAVNSLVYDYMTYKEPDIVSRTRIIETSPQFANPPVVVSTYIDPFLEQRLKDIFLNMDKDDEGQEILSGIKIEKFVQVNDSAYDLIREMRNKIR